MSKADGVSDLKNTKILKKWNCISWQFC